MTHPPFSFLLRLFSIIRMIYASGHASGLCSASLQGAHPPKYGRRIQRPYGAHDLDGHALAAQCFVTETLNIEDQSSPQGRKKEKKPAESVLHMIEFRIHT